MNRKTLISRLINALLYVVGPLTGVFLGISSTMILFSGLSIGANGIKGGIIEGLLRVFGARWPLLWWQPGFFLPLRSS